MAETGDGKCLGHCSDDQPVEDDLDGNWDDDEEEGIVDEP
jgi:hypothetical protein